MDEKGVARFLEDKLPPEHHKLIPYMLVGGRGLEAEGWEITVSKEGLCFQTPMLTFSPENDESFISTSRYRLTFTGFVNSVFSNVYQLWDVKALDKKKWWPMDHPNASGTDICMEPECRYSLDPFIVARSIASMINGYVCEQYNAADYGDINPEKTHG